MYFLDTPIIQLKPDTAVSWLWTSLELVPLFNFLTKDNNQTQFS